VITDANIDRILLAVFQVHDGSDELLHVSCEVDRG
jgi:hypothetical protein